MPDTDLVRAAGYARQALAPATLAAYAADWAGFEAWCAGRGVAALPATPVTVAAYLAAIAATHAGSTLRRRLAAIGRAHRMAGLPWTASPAPATAPCCCWASPRSCAAPSWSRCSASTSPSRPKVCGC
ncbi:site-specific integrase [Paracraurococcus lichenis]|uniref:site-specific integrase n=1 Tax=Paracraurococcus lichenis TaxID=3064888 RepID=UPI00351D7FF8